MANRYDALGLGPSVICRAFEHDTKLLELWNGLENASNEIRMPLPLSRGGQPVGPLIRFESGLHRNV